MLSPEGVWTLRRITNYNVAIASLIAALLFLPFGGAMAVLGLGNDSPGIGLLGLAIVGMFTWHLLRAVWSITLAEELVVRHLFQKRSIPIGDIEGFTVADEAGNVRPVGLGLVGIAAGMAASSALRNTMLTIRTRRGTFKLKVNDGDVAAFGAWHAERTASASPPQPASAPSQPALDPLAGFRNEGGIAADLRGSSSQQFVALDGHVWWMEIDKGRVHKLRPWRDDDRELTADRIGPRAPLLAPLAAELAWKTDPVGAFDALVRHAVVIAGDHVTDPEFDWWCIDRGDAGWQSNSQLVGSLDYHEQWKTRIDDDWVRAMLASRRFFELKYKVAAPPDPPQSTTPEQRIALVRSGQYFGVGAAGDGLSWKEYCVSRAGRLWWMKYRREQASHVEWIEPVVDGQAFPGERSIVDLRAISPEAEAELWQKTSPEPLLAMLRRKQAELEGPHTTPGHTGYVPAWYIRIGPDGTSWVRTETDSEPDDYRGGCIVEVRPTQLSEDEVRAVLRTCSYARITFT
jgi:hypothetical protein